MKTVLLHDGPAYRLELTITPTIDGRKALAFVSTWPTAREPERVQRFQCLLNDAELTTLTEAIKNAK